MPLKVTHAFSRLCHVQLGQGQHPSCKGGSYNLLHVTVELQNGSNVGLLSLQLVEVALQSQHWHSVAACTVSDSCII